MGEFDRTDDLLTQSLVDYVRNQRENRTAANPVLDAVGDLIKGYPERKAKMDERNTKWLSMGIGSMAQGVDKIMDNEQLAERKKMIENRYKKSYNSGHIPAEGMALYDSAINSIDFQINDNTNWNEQMSKLYGKGLGFRDRFSALVNSFPEPDANGKVDLTTTKQGQRALQDFIDMEQEYIRYLQDLQSNHANRFTSNASGMFRNDIAILDENV